MKRTMSRVDDLLTIIDQAYDHVSWHGTNLRGSLRGVSAGLARWRPAPSRHNIRELVVHAAYWKFTAARRIAGNLSGRFPRRGSNWFADTDTDVGANWPADVALLDEMHRLLRATVAALGDPDLPRKARAGRGTNFFIVSGIAAHDLYHAGQIQLLKRLAGEPIS